MGSIPVWADPSGPFTETDGPRRVRPESNAAHQCQIRTDRGSTGRDSGFALARAVHSETALYDRRDDEVTVDEVERILI